MSTDQAIEIVDAGTAIAAVNRSEIDIQIATAKRYPRSVRHFVDECRSLATLDIDTAAAMFYSLPRDGKVIEGPSVRLAEIVAATWGNLRCGARIVSIDEKWVTAQGAAFDLEKNTAVTVEVKRRITNKQGKRFGDDMIGVTSNAACAIALRQAVFKVVPMAFVKPVLAEARKVAVGDAKTLASRRAEMVAYFGKMGVRPEQVCVAVSKASLDDIGLGELATLKGLATAIRDGETTVDEAFPAAPKPPSKSLDELAARMLGKKPAEPPPSTNPHQAVEDAAAREVAAGPNGTTPHVDDHGPPPPADEAQEWSPEVGRREEETIAEQLAATTSIKAVETIRANLGANPNLDGEAVERLERLCTARAADIKATRGERSNGPKQRSFTGEESAVEAGH